MYTEPGIQNPEPETLSNDKETFESLESVDVFDDVVQERAVTYNKLRYDDDILPVLADIKKAPKQENDSVILFCGRPGVGKTKLAVDFACFLDTEFSMEQIVFNHKDLIEVALKLKPGQAIIWDEAREGTESLQAMSQKNQRVGLFLDTVRSRCLFIILIQPSFWNFQMGIATERSDLLVHVYKQKNDKYDRHDDDSMPFVRGFYNVYNFDAKKMLYIKGKKFHNFNCNVKPSNQGLRFGSRWGVDKKEYQKRKDAAVASMNSEAEKNSLVDKDALKIPAVRVRNEIIASIKKNIPSMTFDNVCHLISVEPRIVRKSCDWSTLKMFEFDR